MILLDLASEATGSNMCSDNEHLAWWDMIDVEHVPFKSKTSSTVGEINMLACT